MSLLPIFSFFVIIGCTKRNTKVVRPEAIDSVKSAYTISPNPKESILKMNPKTRITNDDRNNNNVIQIKANFIRLLSLNID